jgi:hypothetical protein
MSAFYDLVNRGLTEALAVIGDTFIYNDATYPCVINEERHSLVTRKAAFPGGRYPKWGELITVGGKVRQVLRLNGSELVAGTGGMTEEPPFVDDPTDPGIEITFDVLIKR